MKLEIKHLAPYLIHRLTFLMESEPNSKEPNIEELKSLDMGLNMVNFGWGNAKPFTEIKPILRPLSSLDKEIEVNGERFVPIEKMKELGLGSLPRSLDCNWLYYHQFEQLVKWHFNVFNLPENLYIDINTLNK